MAVVLIAVVVILVILMLMLAFRVESELVIAVLVLCAIYMVGLLMFDFFRERKFYDDLSNKVSILDKAYLALEMMERANFYKRW